MSDKFSNALLAALNASVEVKEGDWDSIAKVLRGSVNTIDEGSEDTEPQTPENRFAATVSTYMAKVRAHR